MTRYESIIHNLGHFRIDLEPTEDAMTLTWTSALSDSICTASRHVTESVMVGVRVFAERLVARAIPVRALTFTHALQSFQDR